MATKSVLIVDDDPVIIKVLCKFIKDLNLVPIVAQSGQEAWDLMNQNSAEKVGEICAIVSDIIMPDGEGLSLLENIRGHERYGDLPVILMSTSDDPLFRSDAERFGAFAFLIKPITFEQFKATFSRLK